MSARNTSRCSMGRTLVRGLLVVVMELLLGQAYILSLKDGNNSIIIVGGTNSAYDPKMTELDPTWVEAIRKSKFIMILISKY